MADGAGGARNVDTQLNTIIAQNAGRLRVQSDLSPFAILHAIAECESAHGKRGFAALHEPAYCYGGFYYKGPNGETLRELSAQYGCLAHCSYSSWQIMYITAVELGYAGDPCNLRDDAIAIRWVCEMLNRRILDRYPRISAEAVADAYNSGRPYDANKPVDYIDKFMAAYKKWLPQVTTA